MKKIFIITIIIGFVILVGFLGIYIASEKCLSFLQVARFSSPEAVQAYKRECLTATVVNLFK